MDGVTFGRGWSLDRVVAHMVVPDVAPIEACPKAWTPGTTAPP